MVLPGIAVRCLTLHVTPNAPNSDYSSQCRMDIAHNCSGYFGNGILLTPTLEHDMSPVQPWYTLGLIP